jgi:hypothetical protein
MHQNLLDDIKGYPKSSGTNDSTTERISLNSYSFLFLEDTARGIGIYSTIRLEIRGNSTSGTVFTEVFSRIVLKAAIPGVFFG